MSSIEQLRREQEEIARKRAEIEQRLAAAARSSGSIGRAAGRTAAPTASPTGSLGRAAGRTASPHAQRPSSGSQPPVNPFIGTGQRSSQGHIQNPFQQPQRPSSGSLPPGWDVRYTAEGKPYYVHHASRTTQWHPPQYQMPPQAYQTHPQQPPARPPPQQQPYVQQVPARPPQPRSVPLVQRQGASGGPSTSAGSLPVVHRAKSRSLFDELDESIVITDVEVQKKVGAGCFGVVYKGMWQDAIDVALKQVTKDDDEGMEEFVGEVQMLLTLRHPNVIRFYGINKVKSGGPGQSMYMVLEWANAGAVLDYLKKHDLSDEQLMSMAVDAARGMMYLSERNPPVVHRDLALRNLLLSVEGGKFTVKVGDFGLSRFTDAEESADAMYCSQDNKKPLPVRWLAPEAWYDRTFSVKSDVWAFAVTMWELFTAGSVPYDDLTEREVMKAVANGRRLEQPMTCPDELFAVMTSCWTDAPADRPSFRVLYSRLRDVVKELCDRELKTPVMSTPSSGADPFGSDDEAEGPGSARPPKGRFSDSSDDEGVGAFGSVGGEEYLAPGGPEEYLAPDDDGPYVARETGYRSSSPPASGSSGYLIPDAANAAGGSRYVAAGEGFAEAEEERPQEKMEAGRAPIVTRPHSASSPMIPPKPKVPPKPAVVSRGSSCILGGARASSEFKKGLAPTESPPMPMTHSTSITGGFVRKMSIKDTRKSKVVHLLVDTFANLECQFAHCSSKEEKRRRLMTQYFYDAEASYALTERVVYGCEDAEEQISGVAFWCEPGQKYISLTGLLKYTSPIPPNQYSVRSSMKAMSNASTMATMATKHKDAYRIFQIAVAPELQRRGIGTKLMMPVLLEADSKKKPCCALVLTPSAVPFFERFGFEVAEEKSMHFSLRLIVMVRPRQKVVEEL